MSQNVATDKASIFRQKLEAARARRQSEGVEMEFAGFPCKVRVLSRLHFIRAGRMPEYLTQIIILRNQKRSEEADRVADEMTAEQVIRGEEFMRHVVCVTMVEPRVVEASPVPEGGYLFADLLDSAPEFVQAVYEWVMRDCPVPEEEKGEEVLGVEDLEKFSDGAGGGAGAQPGDQGEGGGAAAARVDAADGERAG
ncbi:MAG: hypothetical protein M3444_07365 [Acidobacteriota bacterium]|nr:hypothetical protein [Acidobacteriota bacterium]MDQ5835445.1 hypothetical protein [Acidobacteriota bacterium]